MYINYFIYEKNFRTSHYFAQNMYFNAHLVSDYLIFNLDNFYLQSTHFLLLTQSKCVKLCKNDTFQFSDLSCGIF